MAANENRIGYEIDETLNPGYVWTESQKEAMVINNDINKIDPRTDFGRGIVFKDTNGGEHDNMEAVRCANKLYWDSVMNQAELEKTYFDSIAPKININDRDVLEQILKAQQERFIAYVKEKYGSYFSELLEQYGYGKDVDEGKKK